MDITLDLKMSDSTVSKMDVNMDRERKLEDSSEVSPSLKKYLSLSDLRGACQLKRDESEPNPVVGIVVNAFQDKTFIQPGD